ncbi:hypothetical protein KCU78_g3417, partial [Aureobasidium melanogenum]
MFLSINLRVLICLLLATFWQCSAASPIIDEHSAVASTNATLVKRWFPSFIGYENDPDRLERVKSAFEDAVWMMRNVLTAPLFELVFDAYFDGPDDHDRVLNVFRNIVAPDPADTANEVMRYLVFDNLDQTGECAAELKNNPNVVAILIPDQVTWKTAKIVFCDKAWAYPDLDDINCDDLGDTVTSRMSSLGGVVLHEFMHFRPVAVPAIGEPIIDRAYGPLTVRQFKEDHPTRAVINADNYRWYAQHVYFNNKCGRRFSGPRSPAEAGDPQCGGQVCQIQ